MAAKEFKLPISSTGEVKKLIIAYSKSKSPASLAELAKLTGMNVTMISGNNGFLDSIRVIQGGNSKEATVIGKKLGLAFANNIESEIESNLRQLIEANDFLESMITALGIKPRTSEDFQSHFAYSLGKELKGNIATGTRTIVDFLKAGGAIEEREGLLYPKLQSQKDEVKEDKPVESPHISVEDQGKNNTSLSKQLTGKLGNNVTLNINIQLTIPETENEKVYESFFEAMKKHLLS